MALWEGPILYLGWHIHLHRESSQCLSHLLFTAGAVTLPCVDLCICQSSACQKLLACLKLTYNLDQRAARGHNCKIPQRLLAADCKCHLRMLVRWLEPLTWLCRAAGGQQGSFWAGCQHLWSDAHRSVRGSSLHHSSPCKLRRICRPGDRALSC